jgi:hypothetical protein
MKLKPRDIKRYNKIADKGRKPIMVRVGHKWYTWYEGDPKHGVFLTTQSGRDVEFDFKQIDDIQEGIEKLTKSKLKEMVEEVMNDSLNERRLDSKVKKAILIAIEMSGNMTGAAEKIEKIKKGLSRHKKVKDALRLANESVVKEAKKKVDIEKLSVGNTYTDSKGYPVKIVDISGGGNSWKITYKDGYGKKKIIKTSLSKGVNLYESITEAGMFDDYYDLNRAYMDRFIKNYKKLNSKNVVKKKGGDVYGFRKGEREAHWKYDDDYKLHYDIDKAKVLGLINFFNRAKKNHPWG